MKLIFTIILTAIVVLFAVQNFTHIPIFFIYGQPVQVRLIFVIATSFVGGYFLRFLVGIHREDTLKKKYRLMLRHHKNKGRTVNDILDEEL